MVLAGPNPIQINPTHVQAISKTFPTSSNISSWCVFAIVCDLFQDHAHLYSLDPPPAELADHYVILGFLMSASPWVHPSTYGRVAICVHVAPGFMLRCNVDSLNRLFCQYLPSHAGMWRSRYFICDMSSQLRCV